MHLGVRKMKCRRVRKLLTAFRDGELPEEDRRAVAGHLAVCEGCRQRAAEVAKVFAWAALWRDRKPSAAFLSRVTARARAPEEPATGGLPLRLPRLRLALVGAAAACLVFLFGYLAGVNLPGGRGVRERGPSMARSKPATPKGILPSEIETSPGDSERLIVGVQRIKMIFGSKLNDAAYAQLNEVQRALAAGEGERAKRNLAIVDELQRAEGLIREEKFAEAQEALAWLERSYPEHALAPYARMTNIFAAPQPGYGPGLLGTLYASLLQDAVADPAEFYDELRGLQARATEYGWQKIVDSANRLNPVNLLDRLEGRLVGEKEAL